MESSRRLHGSPPANVGSPTARVAFPQRTADFDKDVRVSYSRSDQKWLLEDDDGSQWEWSIGSDRIGRWIPTVDEQEIEQQRSAYAIQGVDETAPAIERKRKAEETEDVTRARCNAFMRGETDTEFYLQEHGRLTQRKKQKPEEARAERKNTAVYVTNLPEDVTVDEVHRAFSRCGVIAENIDEGGHRIKLYMDDEKRFKGDALIESIQLAIDLLDDSDFRLGQPHPKGPMRVQEADNSYKKQKDVPADRKPNTKDKKKIMQKTQRLNNKLADWDDDDPSTIKGTGSKWDRLVILKHMFTLQELEEDPLAILDIKEDVREEAVKLGDVTNVILYDMEEDGVVTVRFSDEEAAKAYVARCDGRLFTGQTIEAYISDGTERFKKNRDAKTVLPGEDGKDAEDKRMDTYGNFIEAPQVESEEQDAHNGGPKTMG
ncbi:hypothetical protein LTR66_002966 [Elasticomyces elasticus]|nr:hypothetical protein LTR66_002966 [Elasticomyces elasticus]